MSSQARISGAHDSYPAVEPADGGSLRQSYDPAQQPFMDHASDAAYQQLQFDPRACRQQARSDAAAQAKFFGVVRSPKWYQTAEPDDVAQAFRAAVAFGDRPPSPGAALRYLSATVPMRTAPPDVVLGEFPTSVAARLLRATTVAPPPPPIALARLIGADFRAGVLRRLRAPARSSRPTGPPWGVLCSASALGWPGPRGEHRTLSQPPWQVHCAGGLPPEVVQP